MGRLKVIVSCCSLCLSFSLAGCSNSPTLASLVSSKATAQNEWTLHVRSEPPGAEARGPLGQSCRTPCELTLPMADTSVTFRLAGYYPQVIPVKWLPASFHYEMYERTDQSSTVYPVDFSPNPAIARLERSSGTVAPETAATSRPMKKGAATAGPTTPAAGTAQ